MIVPYYQRRDPGQASFGKRLERATYSPISKVIALRIPGPREGPENPVGEEGLRTQGAVRPT